MEKCSGVNNIPLGTSLGREEDSNPTLAPYTGGGGAVWVTFSEVISCQVLSATVYPDKRIGMFPSYSNCFH